MGLVDELFVLYLASMAVVGPVLAAGRVRGWAELACLLHVAGFILVCLAVVLDRLVLR